MKTETRNSPSGTDIGWITLARERSLRDYLGLVARGFCMGSADVVPGVSGGTMAFILGIYEELIDSIRTAGRPEFLRPLSRLRLQQAWNVLNWQFLVAVGSGILLAILTLAKLLEWLLVNQPVIVWSFFFGLVLASVLVVAGRIRRWSVGLGLALAAGTLGAYLLVGLVPIQTPEAGWFLFLSGMIAICAMILPGISGAFLLVLLGKYQYVLSAVTQGDFGTILWVVAGAVVGLVSFSQILGWLFHRYHDATVALLTGLMLGSLRKVWPWKVDLAWIIDRHGERLPTVQKNVLPDLTTSLGWNGEVILAVVFGVLGVFLVVILDRWANRLTKDRQTTSPDGRPAEETKT